MDVSVSSALRSCVDWIRRPPEMSHVRRNVSPTWLTWMPNGVFTLIVWRYYWPALFSRSWRYIDLWVWRREEARRRHSVTCLQNTLYTVFHQTHVGDSVNFQRIFPKKIRCQVLQENCSNVFIKTPPHPKWVATLPNARYITRYSSYIYKLWWGFNDQSKSGLLLSLTVKTYLKSANIWHSYGQKDGLCRALS